MSSMPVLSEVLSRLGLSHYLDDLVANGFHDWETVLDITEDDLAGLHFKLGHRRTLQREIARFRGVPSTESLVPSTPFGELSPGSSSASATFSHTSPPAQREKRRYRRHPRPDGNAPKKPKTAYVNFADQLRTDPEVSSLSFVDIAKEVGRRWQVLPPENKRTWESQAARAMQEYEVQMEEYKKTESWRNYQTYLSEFKAHQLEMSKPKRPTASRVDSCVRGESLRASPVSSDSPGSMPSLSSTSTPGETESIHNTLDHALRELPSLRGDALDQGQIPYDQHRLPPEMLIRQAMHAFVRETGPFLYMWNYYQIDEILDQIYRPDGHVDAITVAECFTIAALGAHYDADCCPDHIRRTLFASATLHFDKRIAQGDYLRTMRLLLSMSFYALLEKHMSVRALLAAGLQIARVGSPPQLKIHSDEEPQIWTKIFQSLVSIDCWLSYTLGYSPSVRPDDIAIACIPRPPNDSTINEMIHFQLNRICLIAAEVANGLKDPGAAVSDNTAMVTKQLEAWATELPPSLQFTAMVSDESPSLSPQQKGAMFTVHAMYLSAIILLYRQRLVTPSESQLTVGATNGLSDTMDNSKWSRAKCGMAAAQLADILHMFSVEDAILRRCWALIYSSFTACIVLLFNASHNLLEGQPDIVEPDLANAKLCLDILETCQKDDAVAKRFYNIMLPVYDHLHDIHHRMVGRAKTSIFMLLQADPSQLSPPISVSKEEVWPILERLSGLLADPFGRAQGQGARKVAEGSGSSSVFWWQ